ncbi:MAG: type II toxin-antitoxin system RelE/ParE family toxin [Myxococcota bacterium]
MRVRLTPEAEADVAQARDWYAERAEQLGADFVASVDAALEQVEAFAELAPIVHASVRRTLLHRFPYGVFYTIEGGEIVVLGCFHARRDPDAWRLRGRDS